MKQGIISYKISFKPSIVDPQIQKLEFDRNSYALHRNHPEWYCTVK